MVARNRSKLPLPPDVAVFRQPELDSMVEASGAECAAEREPHVHLFPHCHPQGGIEVTYFRQYGVLRLRCDFCKTPMAQLEISP